MDKELWNRCVEFHGHQCPGLAIGYKVCEAARVTMGVTFSYDEEIVCVTENDACGVDAVQVITGCSMGKGNLLYKGTGKQAFTFFKRKTGESARFVLKPFTGDMERNERMEYILASDPMDIFEKKDAAYTLPERARLFTNIICEKCGESAPEHKIRFNEGKKLCLDCFPDYSRGW
ncbi:MAG TPA: FmdE family protein [Spirochaetota bacterium]|nr:FmdE family protein [Bacteroidales bacterium]HRX49306.1 FmdE family protein [Spirochaetota bacterium]